jgi:hypothetical protein
MPDAGFGACDDATQRKATQGEIAANWAGAVTHRRRLLAAGVAFGLIA